MKAALITEEQIKAIEDALEDMLSGWKYIRESHGDLYGIGWDRAESKAVKALTIVRSLKVQEPVAWITRRTGDGGVVISGYETCEPTDYDAIPVYTAPTKREWQALAQPEPAISGIRALKHRIHKLEGELIGCKRMLDAQPEQEPVAYLDAVDNKTVYVATNRKSWLDPHEDKEWLQFHYDHCHDTPLYTAPPSKPDVNQEMLDALTQWANAEASNDQIELENARTSRDAALAKHKEQA